MCRCITDTDRAATLHKRKINRGNGFKRQIVDLVADKDVIVGPPMKQSPPSPHEEKTASPAKSNRFKCKKC